MGIYNRVSVDTSKVTGGAGLASEPVSSIHIGKNKRREVLERAADLIDGDRQDDYGSPQNSFSRIAALWTLGIDNQYVFDAKDVAILLALLKVSRIVGDPSKEDSWVDLAGYAGLGAEVS